MKAILVLENGQWFTGSSVGAPGETLGEVVFNTSLTGYQEVLTDPSYAGQIVTMTAPEIGNYGVTPDDVESWRVQVAGFVVRESSPLASNWRAKSTLVDYLTGNGIVAIAGIDTRALTRVLRSAGVMRGAIATGDADPRAVLERVRQIPPMEGQDLVKAVTCDRIFDWDPASAAGDPASDAYTVAPECRATRRLRVAAYDLGMKWNILRRFDAYGCDVRVFPAHVPAAAVAEMAPDGVFFSNGPGDPAVLDYVVRNARAVVSAGLPVFGICLGHQVLAQALGGRTYKLKFGHRGTNHPVKFLPTGQVEITSQNHGFAVDPESLPADVEVTHVNLYDGTVEGVRHREQPVFCVQYHPEAAPGPHDADYLFRLFVEEMERRA
jgi:carbamoyl-phosphate synthase small subunit